MRVSTMVRPLTLRRSWPHWSLVQISRVSAAVLATLRDAIVRWRQSRQLRREHEALRELDPATLRDLGAPPWQQADAQALRESRRFERTLLSMHGGVDGDHRF